MGGSIVFSATRCHFYLVVHVYYVQVAAHATLALLLSAIGGSDMSLQYIFVIHVVMHQSEVSIYKNYGKRRS